MSFSDGVEKLSTACSIAKELGVHKATINRIAKKLEIGSWLGNQRVFTPSQANKIKRSCRIDKGNPNFVKKI